MQINPKNRITDIQLVKIQGNDWLKKQSHAGRAVAECLKTCKNLIENKTDKLSLKDLESICIDIISKFNCTPTFEGYKGFPGKICTSVNKQLVHGIPTDYKLVEGDVVKVDLGATYKGAIADAAITAIYGPPKDPQHVRLLQSCSEALKKSIESIKIGKQLGCIGDTIYRYTKSSGFYLITNYGGHGISWNTPHSQPFVSNKAKKDEGIRIQPGLAIAIEPMLSITSAKTKTLDDGWTVVTPGINAHFEHSIYVGNDKLHIITDYEN